MRLRSIVIIDPDRASQQWLKNELLPMGRPVQVFDDVVAAKEAGSDLAGVAAILVSISADPAVEADVAEPVREVACWIRSLSKSAQPGLLALARRALAPTAMQAALHRGASTIITVDQVLILRELVEAHLRARKAWYPMEDSGFMMVAEGGSAKPMSFLGAGSGRLRTAQEISPMRNVTLVPGPKEVDLPVREHGWIPTREDFQITEADPIDLKVYETKAVLRAIAAAGGNRTLAAQLLGIGKSTLYRRLSEWRASLPT